MINPPPLPKDFLQNFGDQITSPDTIRKYTKMGDLVDQGSISRVGGEGG